ncbi:hypothetical protein ACFXB3_23095 [Streptomyces sp. NPDC059447]|uniref:hypothetical protein n=1 Tax=Streptomyces sp. NPDC059447 TaxID=3346834 RepID=UPI0036815EB7
MTTRLRLLYGTALALLLLTCTIAAWANPRSPATSTDTASAGACARITGPAHEYCTGSPAEPAAVTAPATAEVAGLAGVVPAALGGRGGLLLFSTAAIAGAVGLILTAERRAR